MDQNSKREICTRSIMLFLEKPGLVDELTAARETISHLKDQDDDRALDLIYNIYSALPPDEPRRQIGAMISTVSKTMGIDDRTLWRKDKLVSDLFFKKLRRLKKD